MEKKKKVAEIQPDQNAKAPILQPVNATLERSQSSCVVKTDSKGGKQYEVKCYADTVEEAVDMAIEQSLKLDRYTK